MYKSYYKSGYQPQSKYRMAQRYIKNRVAQDISAKRAIATTRIPKTIYLKPSVPEKKGLDTNLYIASVINTSNTNTNCFVVNLIQQGSGSWNRVGRKVNLKSLRIKGSFIKNCFFLIVN